MPAGVHAPTAARPRLPLLVYAAVALLVPLVAYSAALEPDQTLLVAGVAVVVAACAVRADLALLLLVALAPLEGLFAETTSTLVTPTKLAGALAFVSFLLHAVVTRRRLVFDVSHGVVLAILGIALVSSVFARDVPSALVTTFRYASFAALYMVVSQWVGAHVLQRRIVWVLALSSAAAALVAATRFSTTENAYRASLPHADPNDLAFILATTLPLVFWLLGSRPLLRPLVLALIGAISFGIVLTYSRGALVGLGAATLWLVVSERRRIPLLLAGATATLVAGLVFVQATPEPTYRLETGLMAKQKVAAENVEDRLTAWSAAADLAAEHPVIGIGPGNFRHYLRETAGIPPGVETVAVVHNAYLDVAAELGAAAFVLFLVYLALMFHRLTSAVRDRAGPPGLAAAARTALVVAVVSATTLSEQYYAPFWLIGGLATALWAEARRESAPDA